MGAVVAWTMAPSQVPKLTDTAVAGCCKVCKEPEEKGKRFLICGHSLCIYKYYHIRCLMPEQIASDKQAGEQCWYCPSCLCRGCFCDMDDNEIIMCDGCDEAYHLYCLSPPLTSVPKRHWYCQFCTAAKAREKELKKYEKKMLQLHRKRDRAMVKSDKYVGMHLLMEAVAKLAEEEEAAKLKRDEEAAAAAMEMLRGDEEAATAAE
ncbi:PHD finger protein EHD3-like isoform X3 [Panicum virgatum]|uniref:PHD finger protein EHD3-like isoform X3 n=1 Tax=Panicum virgatum TaxID=38727 RepID=UPI0019D57E9D|nr:PHD finger protein EHD3-like isoform X3 [Panicum virgatum]XP_039808934.1 PHD finger protein EHD3-like isoform X3 [Panicum virgatum]XP_039808936.1 PHD finger protein EHD3-like isoform X3 [Panicum virgatum]